MADFCSGLETYVKAGNVTKQGFCEYYADVNAVLPAEKEHYFIELLLKTWNISTRQVQASGSKVN